MLTHIQLVAMGFDLSWQATESALAITNKLKQIKTHFATTLMDLHSDPHHTTLRINHLSSTPNILELWHSMISWGVSPYVFSEMDSWHWSILTLVVAVAQVRTSNLDPLIYIFWTYIFIFFNAGYANGEFYLKIPLIKLEMIEKLISKATRCVKKSLSNFFIYS